MGPVDLHDIVGKLNIPAPPEVIVGLGTSDDAGVFRIGPDLNMVLTADFITPPCDDAYLFGRIAAANSLSDVYAMGGTAKAVLNLCCFPDRGIDSETLTDIMRGGLDATTEAGAVLIGGHTVKDEELKYGLSVTGLVADAHIRTNAGAQPGDVLILTKPLGSGVIVSGLKCGMIDAAAAQPTFEMMAKLNKTAAEVMNRFDTVHAATDVTGFGLGGHGYEMAAGSGVGIRFQYGNIPRWPLAEKLIAQGMRTGVTSSNGDALAGKVRLGDGVTKEQEMLMYDPQTSGGLLIAISPSEAEALRQGLIDAGIEDAAICGEVFATDDPHLEIVS